MSLSTKWKDRLEYQNVTISKIKGQSRVSECHYQQNKMTDQSIRIWLSTAEGKLLVWRCWVCVFGLAKLRNFEVCTAIFTVYSDSFWKVSVIRVTNTFKTFRRLEMVQKHVTSAAFSPFVISQHVTKTAYRMLCFVERAEAMENILHVPQFDWCSI